MCCSVDDDHTNHDMDGIYLHHIHSIHMYIFVQAILLLLVLLHLVCATGEEGALF